MDTASKSVARELGLNRALTRTERAFVLAVLAAFIFWYLATKHISNERDGLALAVGIAIVLGEIGIAAVFMRCISRSKDRVLLLSCSVIQLVLTLRPLV